MTQRLDIIREVLSNEGINSRLQPGRLTTESQQFSSPHEVRAHIESFTKTYKVQAGWIQTTGAVARYDAAEVQSGIVLCAELAAGDVSLSIRQGSEGWHVVTLHREPADDDQAVLKTVVHRARQPLDRLVYEVAWRLESDPTDQMNSFSAYASRLIGDQR
jgi:hypothetical protein